MPVRLVDPLIPSHSLEWWRRMGRSLEAAAMCEWLMPPTRAISWLCCGRNPDWNYSLGHRLLWVRWVGTSALLEKHGRFWKRSGGSRRKEGMHVSSCNPELCFMPPCWTENEERPKRSATVKPVGCARHEYGVLLLRCHHAGGGTVHHFTESQRRRL